MVYMGVKFDLSHNKTDYEQTEKVCEQRNEQNIFSHEGESNWRIARILLCKYS
jgi:hypothetical protein